MRRIPDLKKKAPGRNAILEKINSIVADSIKSNVNAIIADNLPFTVALDIATTKGMKSSYLGLIISYVDKTLELKDFAFEDIELKDRHTGENLKNITIQALAKFGLSIEKASAIVTDGASNMLAAFK